MLASILRWFFQTSSRSFPQSDCKDILNGSKIKYFATFFMLFCEAGANLKT
jgi:hypothetical protein